MENTQEKIGEQVDATKESLSGKAFLSSQKSADVLSSDKLIQHPYLDQLETINVINKESFDIDFTPDNAFLIQLGLFMDAAKGKQSDMVSFDGEKKVFRLYFETERSDFVAAVREHMAKQSRPIIDEDDQDKELNDMFDYFFKQLEKRIQYVQS